MFPFQSIHKLFHSLRLQTFQLNTQYIKSIWFFSLFSYKGWIELFPKWTIINNHNELQELFGKLHTQIMKSLCSFWLYLQYSWQISKKNWKTLDQRNHSNIVRLSFHSTGFNWNSFKSLWIKIIEKKTGSFKAFECSKILSLAIKTASTWCDRGKFACNHSLFSSWLKTARIHVGKYVLIGVINALSWI